MNPSRGVKELSKYLVFSVLAPLGKWLHTSGVPILTYHSIDESGSPISTTPSAFFTQMGYLREHGFKTIGLSELIDSLKEDRSIPGKAFALTFDDGFKNLYQVAFPVLADFGFTAHIFLVSDYMGKVSSWEVGEKIRHAGADRLPLMSWEEAREMHRHGFDFGSHGSEHLRLPRLTPSRAREDVERSKRAIEENLGAPCRFFCYPYGEFNDTVRQIVREAGFTGAVTLEFGRNKRSTDPHALRRVGSAHFTNGKVFRACIHGTYGWHLRGRKSS